MNVIASYPPSLSCEWQSPLKLVPKGILVRLMSGCFFGVRILSASHGNVQGIILNRIRKWF